MKKFFSFENIIKTITRFPLNFIYIIAITEILIFMNNFDNFNDELIKVVYILVSTFFLNL